MNLKRKLCLCNGDAFTQTPDIIVRIIGYNMLT